MKPIRITRSDVTLDLGTAKLSASAGVPYMIRIEGAHDVVVSGGDFVSGNWGVLVDRSSRTTLTAYASA